MARNSKMGNLTGSQKTGGAGKKQSTKRPSKHPTFKQGGIPNGPINPPKPPPPPPKNPNDVPMSLHSSFFHLSTSMG